MEEWEETVEGKNSVMWELSLWRFTGRKE
ncbi:hypothetical protein LINGRAHAP2_LOCUS3056 [Linum grandiflorum]